MRPGWVRVGVAGYAATTVRDVAAEAGVSVQTVYDSVGSKADLVRGLNDRIDDQAQVHEVVGSLATADDPTVLLAAPAAITRRLMERCADVIRVVVNGQHTASELVETAREGDRRHRAGVEDWMVTTTSRAVLPS
jgi:AcrR family transcriptional regulator